MRPLIEGVREDLQPLVEDRRGLALANVFIDLHAADIAQFIATLGDDDDQVFAFGLIRPEAASDVLAELSEPVRDAITARLSSDDLADLLQGMSADDAADLIQELHPDHAARVLQEMEPGDREAMQPLLDYPEDTAGGLMDPDVLTVSAAGTVGDARDAVRAHAEALGALFYVFVTDEAGRLRGALSLKDLVLCHSSTPVSEAMDGHPVSIDPHMDQEAVAEIFRRYDLLSVAVVDEQMRLLGRVTVDDVVDVMHEEAAEDLARMVGTGDEDFEESSVRRVVFLRLPWILTSLLGGLLAGSVLGHFSGRLSVVALVLVAFVPVITAMGGNAGSQSATIMVRRLALRGVGRREIGGIVVRETRVGLLLGVVCGVAVGLTALMWQGDWFYGVAVGVAMIASILVASTMGTLAPLVFRRLRVDPALATGPFVSMTNDVTGLFIYFGLATLLIKLFGAPGP